MAPSPPQDSATVDSKKVWSQGSLGNNLQEKCVLGVSTNMESSGPTAPSPSEDSSSVGSHDGGIPGSTAQSPLEDKAIPKIWEVVIRDKGDPQLGTL